MGHARPCHHPARDRSSGPTTAEKKADFITLLQTMTVTAIKKGVQGLATESEHVTPSVGSKEDMISALAKYFFPSRKRARGPMAETIEEPDDP